MRSIGVTPGHVVGDVGARRAHAIVGLAVHPFVLHAAPQMLDEHVVPPGTAPIYGQLAALGERDADELFGRKLATLVSIHDLRRTVPEKGLLNYFLGMEGFQRDRHLVREHAPRWKKFSL